MKPAHSTPSSSPIPLWLRFSAIGAGILILLWLPIEDTSEKPAISIALVISVLLALRALCGRQYQQGIIRMTLIGGLAGTAITPIALLLIAFKTGLHSHGIPEFPVEQVIALLRRTPFFSIGGLFVGLGSGAWLSTRKS